MARKKSKGKKGRMVCDFAEFEEYAEKLDELAGHDELKKAISKSLQKSYDLVTANEDREIKKHEQTGRTDESLERNEKVHWDGSVEGYINVGFNLKESLASIFLMYGTPRHNVNHPGMKKDAKLYNGIYGAYTKKKVQEIQKETFESFLKKYMGG